MSGSASSVLFCLVALGAVGLGMDEVVRSRQAFLATPHRTFIVCVRTVADTRPAQDATVSGLGTDPTQASFHRASTRYYWCTEPVWPETDGGPAGYRALITVPSHGLSAVTIRYASTPVDGHTTVREAPLALHLPSNDYRILVDLPTAEPEVPSVSLGLVAHPEQALAP